MNKTLQTFSVPFGVAIMEQKKCTGLRESKFHFSDGTEKYWSGLNTFFIQYICFCESVTLLRLSKKVQILNA